MAWRVQGALDCAPKRDIVLRAQKELYLVADSWGSTKRTAVHHVISEGVQIPRDKKDRDRWKRSEANENISVYSVYCVPALCTALRSALM